MMLNLLLVVSVLGLCIRYRTTEKVLGFVGTFLLGGVVIEYGLGVFSIFSSAQYMSIEAAYEILYGWIPHLTLWGVLLSLYITIWIFTLGSRGIVFTFNTMRLIILSKPKMHLMVS